MADSTQSWFGRAASRVGRAITFSTARNKRLENVGIQRVAFPAADEKTTALISSRDAFEAQVTAGAGPMIDRHSTYPATSLDPEKIESVMREATLGIVYRYADLCEQIRQRDAHLRSVDHGRRAAVANKPFLVLPKDDTPLAGAVANYLRAVVDDIDGFSSSIYSVLTSNCDGYGAGELVYQPGARRFPGIDGKAVMVRGLFPRRIPWVHGKHFRFQQDNRDVPLLDLGAGRYTDLVPGKFLYHRCMGDGISTMRGYIRSVVWLHFLKHASLRDWGIFLHLYGIPQLYGALDKDLWNDAANRALLEKALVAYGTGESAPILPSGMEIKVTPGPTPSAVEAHKALCGYCDSSISKAVQGETLTTEMGGTGSYNASETHAQTKHDVIQGDAVTMAEDVRSDIFRPAVEINIDALALALHTPPDEIRAVVSRCAFETDRETSPEARQRIMLAYAKAGVRISVSQIREENNFRAPSSPGDTLPGETVTVPKDGAVVGAVEAAQGLKNPAPAAPAAVEIPKPEAAQPDGAKPSEQSPASSDAAATPHIDLAPTDIASIVTVDQALASQGLPPVGGAAGAMTVAERKAQVAAAAPPAPGTKPQS